MCRVVVRDEQITIRHSIHLLLLNENEMKISEYNFFVSTKFLIEIGLLRDGSKFIGYPGRDHRQGGGDFFSKKIGGRRLFSKKIGGRILFFEKNRKVKTFFTIKFENPRFHLKKAIFVRRSNKIYVGLSDWSVLIGV